MRIINSYLFITALLVISSCGYQLKACSYRRIRKCHNNLKWLHLCFKIISTKTWITGYILCIDDKNYPIIKINSMSNQKRQLSVNSSGRVDEYEISKSINFELILSNDNKIVDTLTASASYDFNESQMQGTREQEMIANNVIDRTLVRKVVQRIKSTIRSSSQE